MGNWIDKTDLKAVLGETGSTLDTLLDSYANAIEALLDELTGRTWLRTLHTEYHSADQYTDRILLDNWPVDSGESYSVNDDPDWVWGAATAVSASDLRMDYQNGILHHSGFFHQGKQSLKIIYYAGYVADTGLPLGIEEILIRQACHWYQQGKNQSWAKSSESVSERGGTVAYKALIDNLLPDFAALVERESRV